MPDDRSCVCRVRALFLLVWGNGLVYTIRCTLGAFHALAFATDKKFSRKIKYKKIPRVQ